LDAPTEYSGAILRIAVTGEGISHDPATGFVTIRPGLLASGLTLTVTAGEGETGRRYVFAFRSEPIPQDPALPGGPGEPDEPADPEEPGEPGDPEEPGEPGDPEEPGEPGDPEEPGEPGDPDEPEEPGDPEEPDEPGDPDEPEEPVEGAPVRVGILGDLVFERGMTATISASALFAGEDLDYRLEAAPEGTTIDADSGLVTVPTAALLAPSPVVVIARNEAGEARQAFTVSVRASVTVFDSEEALGELAFLTAGAVPSWEIHDEGFARLVVPAQGLAYGDWVLARGDGIYRCLARWTAADATAPGTAFTLSGRMVQSEAGLAGIRLDLVQDGPARRLVLREEGGSLGGEDRVTEAETGWQWGEWHWVELLLDGATVRGRVYPEDAAAPDWQVHGRTERRDGATGPGLPLDALRPVVDIRRLEYRPLDGQIAEEPAAPRDGDWTLEQVTEARTGAELTERT
jgi:hypothetical protein